MASRTPPRSMHSQGEVSPRRAPTRDVHSKAAPSAPPPSQQTFDDTDLSSKRYTTEFDLVYQPGGGPQGNITSTRTVPTAQHWASVVPKAGGALNTNDPPPPLARHPSNNAIVLHERRAPSRDARSREEGGTPRRTEPTTGAEGDLGSSYPPRPALSDNVLRPRTAGSSRPRRSEGGGGPRSRDESPHVGNRPATSGGSRLPLSRGHSPGIRQATPVGRGSGRGGEEFEVGGDFGPSRHKTGSLGPSRSGSRSRMVDVLRKTGVDSEGVLAVDDEEDDAEGSPRVKRPTYSPPEGDGDHLVGGGRGGGARDDDAITPNKNRRRSPSSILNGFNGNTENQNQRATPSPAKPAAKGTKKQAPEGEGEGSDRQPVAPLKVSPAPPDAPPAAPQHTTKIEIGMMIRRWIVTSRIGAGSFGETFCAAEVPESFELDLYERCVEEATKRHHLSCTQTGGGLTTATLGASRGSDSDMDEDSVGGMVRTPNSSSPQHQSKPLVQVGHMQSGTDDIIGGGGLDAQVNGSSVSHEVDVSSRIEGNPTHPVQGHAKSAISLEALAAMPEHMRPTSEVCIKVEQDSKNVLRLEVVSLKKSQPCPNVVRYVGSGHIDAPLSVNYLVMEKLGPNLAELRRQCPHQLFDIYTTLYTGISCLEALRGVHELGLVHRDVKPSNFVVGLGPERSRVCYLIDFGLARRFKRSNGGMRPPRDNAGFRGTNRYASIQSHLHQELGRVDDLWSLLFMLVEFATGSLPWRKYKEKEAIGECKQQTVNAELVRTLPREFLPFLEHLQSLSYEGEPDYDYLIGLLRTSIVRRGYAPDRLLDWEKYAGETLQLDESDAGRTLPLPLKIKPLTTLPVNNGQLNSKGGAETAVQGKGDEGSDAQPAPPAAQVEPPKKKNPHSAAARARAEAEENMGPGTPRPLEHPLATFSTAAAGGNSTAAPNRNRSPIVVPQQATLPSLPQLPPPVNATPTRKLEDSTCGLNVPAEDPTKGVGSSAQYIPDPLEDERESPTHQSSLQIATPVPAATEEFSAIRRNHASPSPRDNPLQQPLSHNPSDEHLDDGTPNNTPITPQQPTSGGALSQSQSQSNFVVDGNAQDAGSGKSENEDAPVVDVGRGAGRGKRLGGKGKDGHTDDMVGGGCCEKGCTVQ